MHGDVMNACDVSQRIEWGQFDAQTHELIDKVLVRHVQQHRIFTAAGVYPAFLLCQYRKVQRRVERKRLALETIQTFEELQQKQTGCRLLRRFRDTGGLLREKSAEHMVIGVLEPALCGRLAKPVQLRLQQREHFFGRESAALVGACEQSPCQTVRVRCLQQGGHVRRSQLDAAQEVFFSHTGGQRVIKVCISIGLVIHRVVPHKFLGYSSRVLLSVAVFDIAQQVRTIFRSFWHSTASKYYFL